MTYHPADDPTDDVPAVQTYDFRSNGTAVTVAVTAADHTLARILRTRIEAVIQRTLSEAEADARNPDAGSPDDRILVTIPLSFQTVLDRRVLNRLYYPGAGSGEDAEHPSDWTDQIRTAVQLTQWDALDILDSHLSTEFYCRVDPGSIDTPSAVLYHPIHTAHDLEAEPF